MTEEDIVQRLARLEDIEALRQLKYRYCAAADDNYDADAVAALFMEDGVWDGGELGRYEGRAAIRTTFTSVKFSVDRACHYCLNPVIEVSGDRAVCGWYLWLVKVGRDGRSTASAGRYLDHCRRIEGRWYFERLTLTMKPLPPFAA